MTRVGFIGIGTMGRPMASRLLAAGHEVVVCDLDPRRADALGARVVETPGEAAAGAEVVITSLPSPEAVEDVVVGRGGVASTAPEGALLLEMSTSPPALARRLAARLAGRLDVLDAPVSGGPQGAEAGTLTIMVGGPAVTFARAQPLLRALGRHVVHVGDHGAGQAAKLCNNLVAGVTMAALGEACAIAVRERLDPATLYGLLTASTGDSRVLRTRFPLAGADSAHPASQGYAPLFAVDLIEKDLALALALAAEHGVEAPVAGAARGAYRTAQEAGLGRLDYSAVHLVSSPGRVPEERPAQAE
ncbi:MAG TPA: NAD(P)-dependent oxidoreductase [Gaiella sp.]